MSKSTGEIPRIGLIGCGAIAETYYLPALAKNPAILDKLIVVDKDEMRIQKMASLFNIKSSVGDFREMLSDVDGVILALPIGLHYPVSMEFLSRGIHVLCEKPLAESANKALEMVVQARKTGAALAVNYFQRLIPSFFKVKQLLIQGALGEILGLDYFVGEKFAWPTVSGFYFNANQSARGALRDRGAHVFDHICWWLQGKPEIVSSYNDSFGGSDALVHIKFKHEACLGEVKISWLSQFPSRFLIKGREAIAEGDVYDYQNLFLAASKGAKKRLKLEARDKLSIGSMIVSNFLEVIKNNEKPIVEGSDVLDSIRFIDECYQKSSRFSMPWYEVIER
jgi:predicted dehydrogenase